MGISLKIYNFANSVPLRWSPQILSGSIDVALQNIIILVKETSRHALCSTSSLPKVKEATRQCDHLLPECRLSHPLIMWPQVMHVSQSNHRKKLGFTVFLPHWASAKCKWLLCPQPPEVTACLPTLRSLFHFKVLLLALIVKQHTSLTLSLVNDILQLFWSLKGLFLLCARACILCM